MHERLEQWHQVQVGLDKVHLRGAARAAPGDLGQHALPQRPRLVALGAPGRGDADRCGRRADRETQIALIDHLGKTLDPPKPATGTEVTQEATATPAVDLVVVIDSSVSMKDEADALNKEVGAAIDTVAATGATTVYVEIEAVPAQRRSPR